MKKFLSILFLLGVILGCNSNCITFADIVTDMKPISTVATPVYTTARPLDIVNNPTAYLNKKICMTSKFSKFSTLGLDYKPAYRNSEKYITFLFLREDAANNIPLSELKMFIKRDIAEKLPDLKEEDIVKVTGTVFSNALGDAWFEADSIEEIKK